MAAQKTCAKHGCRREPTQAFDVFSWFMEQRKQRPVHYEVCDKHAGYFTCSFDKDASERVRRDMQAWPFPEPVEASGT